MGSEAPPYLVVGHLNKPHGTKGEIFAWPLTDHPGSTFAPGVVLFVGDASGENPDPFFAPLEIEAVRPYRRGFLVRFEGTSDRDGAERLRDRYLLRPFGEAERLEEGEVFYHQLLGMEVSTPDGMMIGRIVEVYEIRPADMLEVEDEQGRTRLIPFTKQVVLSVDTDRGLMVIDPPEGLLDL